MTGCFSEQRACLVLMTTAFLASSLRPWCLKEMVTNDLRKYVHVRMRKLRVKRIVKSWWEMSRKATEEEEEEEIKKISVVFFSFFGGEKKHCYIVLCCCFLVLFCFVLFCFCFCFFCFLSFCSFSLVLIHLFSFRSKIGCSEEQTLCKFGREYNVNINNFVIQGKKRFGSWIGIINVLRGP